MPQRLPKAATETTHRNNAARLLLAGVDKDAALKHFYEEWTEARTKALNGRLKNTEGNKLNSKAPSHIVRISSVPTLGQHDVCVILVQFSDAKFTDNSVMTDPAAYYDRFFHEKGFSEHGARGSVYDYYRFASQDKYDPQFKVYGPVTVSGKASDYAGGTTASMPATDRLTRATLEPSGPTVPTSPRAQDKTGLSSRTV